MEIREIVHHKMTKSTSLAPGQKTQDICLCYECGRFSYVWNNNCPIALQNYKFCREHGVCASIVTCPRFITPADYSKMLEEERKKQKEYIEKLEQNNLDKHEGYFNGAIEEDFDDDFTDEDVEDEADFDVYEEPEDEQVTFPVEDVGEDDGYDEFL